MAERDADEPAAAIDGPVVIVGAGLAGLRAAESLRDAGHAGPIVLVGDEPHLPYDRPPLSKEVLRGERDDTTLKPREFFTDNGIDVRHGTEAVGLDPANKVVRTRDGADVPYQRLIVATGLRPRRIRGFPAEAHVLRSVADARAIRSEIAPRRRALVVGAGFIGCEVAAGLRAREVEVVLVEPMAQPLSAVVGGTVGALVGRLHRDAGVDLRCGASVVSVVRDDETGSTTATLDDGTTIETDFVVMGVGSEPVTGWLAGSGVELADPAAGGGVLTDAFGRTNVADVWALGDVAAWPQPGGGHRRVEHWSNVADQARALAGAMTATTADEVPPPASVPYFWSDQYDVKIQVLGSPAPSDEVAVVTDDGHRFVVYYHRAGTLTAVAGAGLPRQVMSMRRALMTETPIAELLTQA